MVHVIRTGSRGLTCTLKSVTLHFALAPLLLAGFDSQVEWSGNPRRSPFERFSKSFLDRAEIPGGVSWGIFFSVANHDVTSTVSTDPIMF